MTYKTSDIIKRAKQLADLENSDFISYEENFMLINECYNKLYEKLINHNDKAFIKTVNLTGGYANGGKAVYELPSDFWQLYGVRVTESNVPLPRKAQSESDTKPSYDIEGNELVIYGHRLGSLVMDYWTRPPELTYPRNPTRLDLSGIESCYGNMAIQKDNGNYQLIDLDGNILHDFNESLITQAVTGKNAAAIVHTSGGAVAIKIYRNGTESQDTGVYCTWVNHGVVYYSKYLADKIEVYTQNGILSYTLPFVQGISSFVFAGKDFVLAKDGYNTLKACYLDENGQIEETVETDIKIKANSPVLYESGNIFFVDANENIACYDLEAMQFHELNEDFDAVCLAWQGEKSGYGYINTSGALCSFYPDTVLDFTHNFYFTLLSYYLAIAYKAKQNADSTALSAMAGEAEEHFYDTIGRDAYNVTRIRNHYA